MAEITHQIASANILAACDAGTLVQGKWHDRDREGREIVCLLGAISPKVNSPADCNGDLMPMWLAELTPTLFDGLPKASVFPIARRYGSLVALWHILSSAQWDAILTRVLVRCIDDAVDAARPVCEGKAYWPAVDSACAMVRRALNGDGDIESASAAWSAARSASAAASAARAAAEAARAAAAAWAAAAAAWSAARSASAAASAAWSAARSASAAAAAAWAAAAAAWSASAAAEAAYERLFHFVLDQIEAEVALVLGGLALAQMGKQP